MASSSSERLAVRPRLVHLPLILAVFALPVIAVLVRGDAALRGVVPSLPATGERDSHSDSAPLAGCAGDSCLGAGWAGANLGVYDPEDGFGASPRVAIEHVYLHWERVESSALAADLARIAARERWPMLTVEPWPNDPGGAVTLLHDVAAGRYDARIDVICMAIGELDRPAFLRWGHEMELDTGRYPWSSQDPDAYITAYRHVVDRCRSAAPRIYTVWSPAGNAGLERYWPGREYADYVGLSVFSYPSWDLGYYGRVRGFEETLAERYGRIAGYDRPVLIAELGVTGDPAYQVGWIKEGWGALSRYPLVRTVVYFNAVDTDLAWGADLATPDWRIDPSAFE